MTRKQGREYLFQQLKPLVPSDSLDMVLEYLCSYDPINTQDMLTFLHDVCSNHNNLNDILQKYVEICNQLDTNSTIFVPKQYHQENRKHKENHSSEQSSKTISQTQSSQNSRQSNNHQKKKNHQAPGVSEPITFVGTGKKNEKQHRKQPSSSHNNSNKKNTDISTRHLCGCFATHHDFYTSCLSCGRIHCSLEGPGQCVFCGLDLIPPLSADIACEVLGAPNDEVVLGAYLQKDKLLTFDKEHAKRTQVHDAQVES